MDWKKLACCAVLSGASMGLVACGDDDGTGGGPDNPDDGMTRVYVVSTVSIPEAMDGRAPGYNLDGVVSNGEGETCVDVAEDFTSVTDPSETGVDNALAELAPVLAGIAGIDIDEAIAAQIAEGSLLLLLEVSDIDSFGNDSSVSVQLHLGSVPGGGAPELDGAALRAGQTFNSMQALGTPVAGEITGGRLRADTPRLVLEINTGDLELDLVISDAIIGASITDTRLANGAIGGSLRIDDLREAVAGIDPMYADYVDTLVAPSYADLDPSADDPELCTALSVGLLFSGVDAVLGGS